MFHTCMPSLSPAQLHAASPPGGEVTNQLTKKGDANEFSFDVQDLLDLHHAFPIVFGHVITENLVQLPR